MRIEGNSHHQSQTTEEVEALKKKGLPAGRPVCASASLSTERCLIGTSTATQDRSTRQQARYISKFVQKSPLNSFIDMTCFASKALLAPSGSSSARTNHLSIRYVSLQAAKEN